MDKVQVVKLIREEALAHLEKDGIAESKALLAVAKKIETEWRSVVAVEVLPPIPVLPKQLTLDTGCTVTYLSYKELLSKHGLKKEMVRDRVGRYVMTNFKPGEHCPRHVITYFLETIYPFLKGTIVGRNTERRKSGAQALTDTLFADFAKKYATKPGIYSLCLVKKDRWGVSPLPLGQPGPV